MDKTKLRHTIFAVIAIIGIIGPPLLAALGAIKSTTVQVIVPLLSTLVLACTNGRAIAIIGPLMDALWPKPEDGDKKPPTGGGFGL